uniref:aspartate transaminase n=1 Tax=Terrapene triunguis TaxID=2587831 RepID=A0A674I196_9SAUR
MAVAAGGCSPPRAWPLEGTVMHMSPTETGKAWVCPTVRQTLLQIANDPTLDHEYLPVLGFPEFTRAATELALGRESRAVIENRVWTLSSTTSRASTQFLSATPLLTCPVYVPADSLRCIFQDAGFTEIRPYHYWDTVRLAVAIEEFLEVLEVWSWLELCQVPLVLNPSLFMSHSCSRKHLFPFFDVRAQGLASGDLDRDAWALRHFVAQGFELFCAQSFSKTFGLYDEQVGNLIVVARDNETLVGIRSQLQKQVTGTWATPASLGARVIATVLNNPALLNKWKQSLRMLAEKIMLIREKLKEKLRILGTPGCWEHLTAQSGTRSFTGLLPSQVAFLEKHKHIYLLGSGQVSVCSINSHNLDYVAQSINEAVSGTAGRAQGLSWAEME